MCINVQSGNLSELSSGGVQASGGLLRTGRGLASDVVSMGTSSDQEDAPLVQAEVIVQVLVEFWLNQNHYNGRQGDILTQAQVQTCVYHV